MEDVEEQITIPQEVPDKNIPASGEKIFASKEIILFENLELPQKIIFSIASLAITFIICFVIAHKIDHTGRLTKTWMVWLAFILIQVSLQNKFWASNGRLVFSFKSPLFSPYKQWAKTKEGSSNFLTKALSITKLLVISVIYVVRKYYFILVITLLVINGIYYAIEGDTEELKLVAEAGVGWGVIYLFLR